MKTKDLLVPSCLAALIYFSSCAGLQVSGDVQSGRGALQTGRPNDAVAYLTRAAATDPGYRTPYRVDEGVLTLLGRAYYETGRDQEARGALEQAAKLKPDDSLARLYLGLTLLRGADNDRGRKEISAGLKGIFDTIEYLSADNYNGQFWDPARSLRGNIEQALTTKLDDREFAAAALAVGKDFDEEIDRARRDESTRNRGGGDSGGN